MNRRSFFAMFAIGLCVRPEKNLGRWKEVDVIDLGATSEFVYKHISGTYEALRKVRVSNENLRRMMEK